MNRLNILFLIVTFICGGSSINIIGMDTNNNKLVILNECSEKIVLECIFPLINKYTSIMPVSFCATIKPNETKDAPLLKYVRIKMGKLRAKDMVDVELVRVLVISQRKQDANEIIINGQYSIPLLSN